MNLAWLISQAKNSLTNENSQFYVFDAAAEWFSSIARAACLPWAMDETTEEGPTRASPTSHNLPCRG